MGVKEPPQAAERSELVLDAHPTAPTITLEAAPGGLLTSPWANPRQPQVPTPRQASNSGDQNSDLKPQADQ